MAIVTSQQINEYYDKYSQIDVTFTKEINDSLRIVRNQIYLKFKGGQRSCIIYSSSLVEAKVVVALTDPLVKSLQHDNLVALRFCFYKEDHSDIFNFFVQSRVSGMTQYDKERNLYFVQLTFTQRPPADLIEALGNLLEANINAARRGEERIVINQESLRKLGFASKSVPIQIEGIPRNGILRDISFGGLKIIIMGNPKFLINKTAVIRLTMTAGESLTLKGVIIRFEAVEGRKDLAALAIKYDTESITFEYKMLINDYMKYAGRSAAVRERNDEQ
ncbi:MAG: PilZ domain-containing protein [Spirochaetaceae bacterium]|nr:PilZ domain-containing protein [Spirochaetaceae bacterium]